MKQSPTRPESMQRRSLQTLLICACLAIFAYGTNWIVPRHGYSDARAEQIAIEAEALFVRMEDHEYRISPEEVFEILGVERSRLVKLNLSGMWHVSLLRWRISAQYEIALSAGDTTPYRVFHVHVRPFKEDERDSPLRQLWGYFW